MGGVYAIDLNDIVLEEYGKYDICIFTPVLDYGFKELTARVLEEFDAEKCLGMIAEPSISYTHQPSYNTKLIKELINKFKL